MSFKDDIAAPKIRKTFGIITCLSTLEHIPTHIQAIRAMASLLKENGILVLTFPYNENRYVENVYALPGAGYGRDNPYICQVFSRSTVDAWVRETELQLVQQRYFCAFTGELWTFGQRLRPMLEVAVDEPHHLTGIIFRRNAGGQVKGAA